MRHTTGLRLYFRVSHADSLAQKVFSPLRAADWSNIIGYHVPLPPVQSLSPASQALQDFLCWRPGVRSLSRLCGNPGSRLCRPMCGGGSAPPEVAPLIIPGATPLSWGIAPDSINSSRKGTALPHIGRHSRNYHSSAARTGPKNFLYKARTENYELDHQYSKKEYTAQLCL